MDEWSELLNTSRTTWLNCLDDATMLVLEEGCLLVGVVVCSSFIVKSTELHHIIRSEKLFLAMSGEKKSPHCFLTAKTGLHQPRR